MANLRIFYDNRIKAATTTATNSETNYSVSNVSELDPRKTWRSQNKTGAYYITSDFGTSTAIAGVWLVNHNISSGNIVLQTASDSGFTANVTTDNLTNYGLSRVRYNATGVIETYSYRFAYLAATRTNRYFRIVLNGLTAAESYYEIGEICYMKSDYAVTANYKTDFKWGEFLSRTIISGRFGNTMHTIDFQRFEGGFNFRSDLTQSYYLTERIPFEKSIILCPLGLSGNYGYYGYITTSNVSHIQSIDSGISDKEYSINFTEII